MKNKTKKLAYIFGSITATVTPLATVIACSSASGEHTKTETETITEIEKIKRKIETHLKDKLEVNDFQNTLVNDAYEQWNTSTSNGIVMDVVRTPKGNDGNQIPSGPAFVQKLKPNDDNDLHFIIGIHFGLFVANFNSDGTIIDIVRTPNGNFGTDIPSLESGFIQKLRPNDDNDLHYIIGTREDGLLVANFNSDGIVTSVVRASKGTDSVKFGFIQKLKPNDDNDLHYIVGTYENGVLVANFDSNGTVTNIVRTPKGTTGNQIPDVSSAFIQKLKPNDDNDLHFIIGTGFEELLVANFNNDGTVTDVKRVSKGTDGNQIPGVRAGFIQKLKPNDDNDLHYIIGTGFEGLLVANFDSNGTVTNVVRIPKGTNGIEIPDVEYGFIKKLKPNDDNDLRYIIGTYQNGLLVANFNNDGTVTDVKWISYGTDGNKIPSVASGYAQKLKPNDDSDLHYIIGTRINGVLVANMLPTILKVEKEEDHLKITLGDSTATIEGFKTSETV